MGIVRGFADSLLAFLGKVTKTVTRVGLITLAFNFSFNLSLFLIAFSPKLKYLNPMVVEPFILTIGFNPSEFLCSPSI